MVFVGGGTELYAGELGYVTVKDTCHVVIELVGIRADMHGHYGFVELVFTVGNFVFNLKSATIIQYTIKGRFMSR
jgi:hypothetical protein